MKKMIHLTFSKAGIISAKKGTLESIPRSEIMQLGGTPAGIPLARVEPFRCIELLMRQRLWLVATIILLSISLPRPAVGADSSAPSIAFADTTIRIPSGMGTWTRKDIVIRGENLDPAVVGDNPTFSYQDLYVEGPSDLTVKLQNVRAIGGDSKSKMWLADAEISNLPPDSTFKRRILFIYGKITVAFDYSVTNRPEGAFTWSIKPALKELLLNDSREIAVIVSTGDIGATNVHLAMSSLQDDASKSSLGREHLQLCVVNGINCKPEPFSLAPHTSSQPMWLKVDEAFSQVGVFKGMIWIGVDQKQEPDSIELTVYSTSTDHQLLGALCIFLGVALWWFVAVFARQRAARAEALIPVMELRESVGDLLSDLDRIDGSNIYKMDKIRRQLSRMWDELNPSKGPLSTLIPLEFPSISGLKLSVPDPNASLKEFLDTRAAQVAVLSVLVRQGGDEVLARLKEATDAGKPDLIQNSLQALDNAADGIKNVDDARSKVQDVVRGIQIGLLKGAAQDVRLFSLPPLPTTKELRLVLRRLSFSVWLIWGAVTVLVGVYAVILTNHGFGTGYDYIKCFLWGLSIQAVGQQLQQLTTSSVATSLKVPISP